MQNIVNLTDLMFWRKKDKEIKEISVDEAGGKSSGGQITSSNINNFVVKAVGFTGDDNSDDFTSPEVDLSEIKNAVNGDSYIKMAISKQSQLIFKAGYSIVSENDAAAEYLRGRLRMMSFMTGTPTDMLFQQTADDLVTYSNAFWIKSRQQMSNIGGLQAKGVFDSNPVCGYFRVDPATITIKRDKSGTIKQYQQEAGNNKKTFKPTDVVHFYIDKSGGAAFGTPRIIAAIEDVKLLRKIEGNVLNLIYRYSSPTYQMKIGIAEAGLMATDKEIKEAQKEVEKMSNDGILVTNERTEFKAIGADGVALDITGYLSYFEKRVFSALNSSESMMGRGGAKQDADSMEEQIHDTVKYYQFCFSTIIRELVFNELLLEGGYNPIANEQDICSFAFNEINNETRVKMETHALNQFQGNCITFEEMRKLTGRRADNVDESRLYANQIQTPNAISLIQAKMGGNTGNSDNQNANTGPDKKIKDNSGTVKNTIEPENKNGKSSVHIKENLDKDILESNKDSNIITKENIDNYKKNFKNIDKRYNSLRNDICEHGNSYATLAIARDGIVKELKEYTAIKVQEGINKAIKDSGKKDFVINKLSMSLIDDKIDEISKSIFKDINKKIKKANNRQEKEAVFDSIEYRLRFLTEHIVDKSYWYGYIKTCQQLKINKIYVNFGKSNDKDKYERVINTSSFILEDIPPFHAYCTCKLSLNDKN